MKASSCTPGLPSGAPATLPRWGLLAALEGALAELRSEELAWLHLHTAHMPTDAGGGYDPAQPSEKSVRTAVFMKARGSSAASAMSAAALPEDLGKAAVNEWVGAIQIQGHRYVVHTGKPSGPPLTSGPCLLRDAPGGLVDWCQQQELCNPGSPPLAASRRLVSAAGAL